jgi:hypothetical protein
VHLRHARSFFRAQRCAAQRGEILKAVLFLLSRFLFLARLIGCIECQVTIVDRLQ